MITRTIFPYVQAVLIQRHGVHINSVLVFEFVFHSSVAATQMSERMMSPVVYKQLIQVQLIHCGRAFASKRKQRSHRCALATTSHQRVKFY